MKYKKCLIIIFSILSILFISLIILCREGFLKNLSMALLGSLIVALVITILDFFAERRKLLISLLSVLMNLSMQFSKVVIQRKDENLLKSNKEVLYGLKENMGVTRNSISIIKNNIKWFFSGNELTDKIEVLETSLKEFDEYLNGHCVDAYLRFDINNSEIKDKILDLVITYDNNNNDEHYYITQVKMISDIINWIN